MVREQDALKEREGKVQMNKLFDLISNDKIENFIASFEDVSAYNKILFSEGYISVSTLCDKILNLNNFSKRRFTEWLYDGYLSNGINYFKSLRVTEMPFLKLLQVSLTKSLQDNMPIASWHINKMMSIIQQAIEEIEPKSNSVSDA